ncbi:hypothetical protein CCAX7_44900 [Capsulimonas corticalis]|uniref:Uncharacterized protein n=2 Tax=Capsulimonas corticalis TaxID=2219043 RepID=A0A402D6J2_9BACT|nr:hypothetical protein CCAX7_44900 [Capsulimonas corticalis]
MAACALGIAALLPASKPAAAATSFEQSVYLYNQAYDLNLNGPAGQGTGNWGSYRSWLGVANLGAEADPGWGPGDWYDCCQHVNWNSPWSTMQQRYGANLPTVILGMGQMPADPNGNDSWNQKLAWEDATWQAEANNDPTIMSYFANYAQEVNSLGFKKVIVRLGYEFDGGWNPFGNLNVMSNMPNNYIAAWRNIVNTMRANDPNHLIKFCWNPTDGNVQVWAPNFYPGDAYVDYIGIDTYDYAYGGVYPVGTTQPTQAQRDSAWFNSELPRINVFADLARTHGKPMVIGEWGLWQLNDGSHPSGGDNTSYLQRMYNWMSDPNNHVAAECYFEAPADGNSSLSGIFGATTFPKSAALYKQLFGDAGFTSVPPVPAGLSATAASGQVSLSWDFTGGATSYNIYRGTTAGGESATAIATGVTATSYVNTGLTNGTRYYYKIKGVNSKGASAYSSEVNATPVVPANYLVNPGFEAGNLSGWNMWVGGNSGAAYASNYTGDARTGSWGYTNWSTSPYELTLYQQVTVPNGSHTISAWVKNSGGQAACQMIVQYHGGSPVTVNIPAASAWIKISTTVNVTTGTLEVSFYSHASGNQWLNLDDVVVN